MSYLTKKYHEYWEGLKSWFKYSETIFIARVTALIGFITAVVGQLDLSPLWTMFSTGTAFSDRQLLWMGVGILGTGITFEIARRRNAKDL